MCYVLPPLDHCPFASYLVSHQFWPRSHLFVDLYVVQQDPHDLLAERLASLLPRHPPQTTLALDILGASGPVDLLTGATHSRTGVPCCTQSRLFSTLLDDMHRPHFSV